MYVLRNALSLSPRSSLMGHLCSGKRRNKRRRHPADVADASAPKLCCTTQKAFICDDNGRRLSLSSDDRSRLPLCPAYSMRQRYRSRLRPAACIWGLGCHFRIYRVAPPSYNTHTLFVCTKERRPPIRQSMASFDINRAGRRAMCVLVSQ